MFQRNSDPSPFKPRRSRSFHRFVGRLLQWRGNEDETHFGRASRFARIQGKIVDFFYQAVEYVSRAADGVFVPIRKAMYRIFIAPLNRWQLVAEENRNRHARVGTVSKVLKAFHYRVWRLSEWLQAHSAIVRQLLRPFRAAIRLTYRAQAAMVVGYDRLEKRLAESKWLYFLWLILHGLETTASSSYEFGRTWFFSRNFRLLLGGLPAMTMSMAIGYFLIRIPFHSAPSKAAHYRVAAQEAWKAGDFETARLCYRKIQQIGVAVESALFQNAITSDDEGDVDAAFRQMQDVVTEFDFAPAKLWIVQTLISGRLKEPPKNGAQLCDDYLQEILRLDPNNLSARLLQSARNRQLGKTNEALAELHSLAREYPPANLTIAQILSEQQQFAEAGEILESTIAFYQKRFDDHIPLTVGEYQGWMKALSISGAYARLLEVGSEAVRAFPDDRQLKRYLVELYGWVADRLIGNETNGEMRAKVLEQALQWAPEDKATMERMALLVNDARWGEHARSFLARNDGKLPSNVHGALAVAACARGDYAAARTHFTEVVVSHPESGEAANNLAWVLIHSEPVDLQKALELSTRAITIDPTSAAYRETRGQILSKLEHWQEAADEFERALNGMPEEADLHQSLATAYERLGQLALAEVHRSMATTSAKSQ